MGLGSMQFGRAMNMGRLDQAATTRLVRLAIDRGVNLIDTADVYSRGESETLIGAALEGVRDRVVLATKVRLPMSDDDVNRSGAHRVNIMRGIDESLRRLRTDHVDLYQLHGWDSNTPLEETLRAMDDVVRQGKVRYIGLSNYLAWQAATALGLGSTHGVAMISSSATADLNIVAKVAYTWRMLLGASAPFFRRSSTTSRMCLGRTSSMRISPRIPDACRTRVRSSSQLLMPIERRAEIQPSAYLETVTASPGLSPMSAPTFFRASIPASSSRRKRRAFASSPTGNGVGVPSHLPASVL
jgi:hypothetical protein